jgi:hypothetical protein
MAIGRFVRATAALGSLLGLGALASGCGEDEAPGCVPTLTAEVKTAAAGMASSLATMDQVRLDRIGDAGFALVGYDGMDTLRWGALSDAGVLSAETSLAVPPRVAGPWFALAGKSAPGDQLIVVFAAAKAGSPNQLELQAVVQPAGGAASAPRRLVDLPAGVDPRTLRVAMGTTQTGRRAGLVWGFAGQKVQPEFLILRPDAEPQALPPRPLRDLPADWDCLSIVQSRSQLAVTALGRMSGTTTWALSELNEDQGIQFTVRLPLATTGLECPAVAPTKRGYALAYVTQDGLFFTEYDIMKNTANPVLTAGSVRFGGPSKLPRVAGVAWMGRDFGLALERPRGPEVWRVDVFSHRKGGALLLPSSGSIGAVSTWPGVPGTLDALYATYLDGAGAVDATGKAGPRRRYLVKVECPTAP